MIKFLFFVLCIWASPVFAQRKVEVTVKKEVIETDTRIDLEKDKKHPIICGKDAKTAYALVGDLFFPPFSWLLSTNDGQVTKNTLQGVGVDLFEILLKKTFKKAFFSANIIVDDNKEIMRSIIRGSADIYVDAYYEVSQNNGMEYIYPSYLPLHIVTITRKGDRNTVISSVEDLKKYKGVVRENENSEWIYNSIGLDFNTDNDKLKTMEVDKDTVKNMFTMLMSGEVDYILMNVYSARAEMYRYKVYNSLQINEENILKTNRLFFTVSKMSPLCRIYTKNIENTLNEVLNDEEIIKKIVLDNINKYRLQYKDDPRLTVPLKNPPEPQKKD